MREKAQKQNKYEKICSGVERKRCKIINELKMFRGGLKPLGGVVTIFEAICRALTMSGNYSRECDSPLNFDLVTNQASSEKLFAFFLSVSSNVSW